MHKGPPHFSCSLNSQANIWLIITSCLFYEDRFISAISGEDHGINLRPDQKNGLGQLDSLGELNKLLVRRWNRTAGIKWCPEVEKDHDRLRKAKESAWERGERATDQYGQRYIMKTRKRDDMFSRALRNYPSKALPVLRFLSNHYPCYYCNIALHWLTFHLHSIS